MKKLRQSDDNSASERTHLSGDDIDASKFTSPSLNLQNSSSSVNTSINEVHTEEMNVLVKM